MTRSLLLACLLLATQWMAAQSNGYYTIGINGGWSYQSSDVRIGEDGFGLGLTAGRSLIYRPGAPISFDIRGRFLFARQYGQDHERSFDIANNTALNGSKVLNYQTYEGIFPPVEEGYVFHNYRTTLGELSAELVLHLNQLRERTNFILSFYGGAGIDLYRTRINQADELGEEYYLGYSTLDLSQSRQDICDELTLNILDDTYETPAETFESGPKLDFMPSAGIEIGYQLSPNLALLFGHRITFSGTDLLDGNQWADPSNNDWYHYTNFGLEWRIQAAGRRQKPPVITILQPTQIPANTYDAYPIITAAILNINSPADVTCNINGRQLNFDLFGEDFTTRPALRQGRNEITITARNDAGMDRKKVIFILQGGGPTPNPPPPPPPITPSGQRPYVQITQPTSDPFRTNRDQVTIRADVRGVRNKSDIKFQVNGNTSSSFSYDPSDDEFIASLRLRPGQNEIEIQAANPAGSARDAVTIIVGGSTNAGPQVNFTYPGSSPHSTNAESITLRAQINNVSSRNQVSFRVNGKQNNSFTLNGNQFTASVRLSNGQNNFTLSASTNAGQDSDQMIVNKSVTGQGPIVNIIQPGNSNSTTQNNQVQLVANVQNVNGKSDIKVSVNGDNTRLFTYSGGQVKATLDLEPGNNILVVQAFNPVGSAQDQVTIKYQSGGSTDTPPQVTITSPSNGATFSTGRINLQAKVKHVTQKSQIDLRVNGTRVTNFNFQSGTGKLSATIDLRNGNNTIKITATNSDGTDSDQITVRLEQKQPPVVTISEPDNGAVVKGGKVEVRAVIQHVSSKSGVRLQLNGTNITDFSFSNSTLTAELTLQNGVNKILVTGTNADGTDTEQVKVTYSKPSTPKPVISFTIPKRPGKTTNERNYTFQARVQNVTDKGDIKVSFNGQQVRNFQFQGRSGVVTVPVTLMPRGRNTLEIEATNAGGTTTKSTYVTFRADPGPPVGGGPTVSIDQISQPATNPFNPNVGTSSVTASTTSVSTSGQISITLNGNAVTDFSFNSSTGKLTFDVTVPRGSNTLRIMVTTAAGSDTAEATIDF